MKGQNVMVRGTLCALLGGVCWGFSGTMGQYLFAQKGLETAWVTTVRMLLAGVLLLGVMAARRCRETVRVWTVGKDARRLILFAALGLIPCQFTYLECIAYSNSATGTALVASVLAEVYSAVPEEAALTAVLSNAASMVSLMLFIFLLQGAGCL